MIETNFYKQYSVGCILYAMINSGLISEDILPTKLKNSKGRYWSRDEKTFTNLLDKIDVQFDLMNTWIKLGGVDKFFDNCTIDDVYREYEIAKMHSNEDDYTFCLNILKKINKAHYFANCTSDKLNIEIVADYNENADLYNSILKENTILGNKNHHYFVYKGIDEETGKYIIRDSLQNRDLLMPSEMWKKDTFIVNIKRG